MTYEIKELGVGEILDQAIQILKNHFGLLFGIVAVTYMPTIFVLNYLTPPFPLNFSRESFETWIRASQEAQIYTLPLSLLLGYVIGPVTNAAVVWAVAKLYLGETATFSSAFGRAFKLIFHLIITNLLFVMVVGLGSVLCLVPGLIFMFWFCLCNHVVIIENIWGPKALSRSKELVKGSFGTIFVLGFMIFVLQIMISGGTFFFGQNIIQAIVTTIVSSGLMIFFIAIGVVLYFSCRCKTEHFDLNILANAVAQEES